MAVGTVAAVSEGPRCNQGSRRERRNWAITDVAVRAEAKGHLNTSKSVDIATDRRW